MIAIDTNVIVRFLTHDDEQQYQKSYALFHKHEIFIPDTVILETEWVLRYAYNFEVETICDAFVRLFGLKNIQLANPSFVFQAIAWHRQGMDFSDALHLTHCQKYKKLYTFDKKFSVKAKGVTQCLVTQP